MIDPLIRTTVVLIAGFALVGIVASRSAAIRHGMLAATLVAATAVVPLSLATPVWTIGIPSFSLPSTAASTRSTAAAAGGGGPIAVRTTAAPPRGVAIAPLIWAAGFLAALAMLAIGVFRLARLAARATPITDARWLAECRAIGARYGIHRAVALVEADAPFVPATWGSRPPCVLLPPQAREWTAARMHAVLCHELAHVARADWLVQLAIQIVAAALWFNPLAWIAVRQLRREAELACDDAALAHGVDAADYAMHLVALARDCRRPSWAWMPALRMARPSAFERRIAAMLNPRLDRSPLSRRSAGAVAAAAIAVTLAAGTVRAIQTPPAALSGTVYDTTGAVLPGVALTLEDPQQHTAPATTDASGRFAFPGVGSGRYVLSAALPGFRELHDEFDLKGVADWDRAVTLQVGTVRETITVSAGRLAPAAAPSTAESAAPVRVRVGGNIRQPRKELDVHPVYPQSMRAAGREGQVPIEAVIGRDGTVSAVRVLSAQVHPDFAIAAADAVRQWRFTPTLLNGQPVEVVMTVSVRFSLSD